MRDVAGCGRIGCRLLSGSDGGSAVEFPAGADGVEQRARTRRPGGEDGIGGQLLDEPVGGGDTLPGADGVVAQLGQQVGRAGVVAAVMPIAAQYLGDGLVVDIAGLGCGCARPLR